MSDDLVKRLRGLSGCDARAGEPLGKCMREAADEIERLRHLVTSQSQSIVELEEENFRVSEIIRAVPPAAPKEYDGLIARLRMDMEPTDSDMEDAADALAAMQEQAQWYDQTVCALRDDLGSAHARLAEAQARIAALEEALTLIANAPVPDTRFNGRGMVPDFDGFKVIARAALAKGEVK